MEDRMAYHALVRLTLSCSCLQLNNLEIAKKCLELYMLEVRKYSGNVTPVEINDQWLCRAYYALGQLVSEQSKTLKVGHKRARV